MARTDELKALLDEVERVHRQSPAQVQRTVVRLNAAANAYTLMAANTTEHQDKVALSDAARLIAKLEDLLAHPPGATNA